MALHHRIEIPDSAVEQLAKWYPEHTIPEAFASTPAIGLKAVKKLCEGDWRRCVANPNGSIDVYNRRMW